QPLKPSKNERIKKNKFALREDHFWELVLDVYKKSSELLIRASKSEQLQIITDQGNHNLWNHIESQPPLGTQKIRIPASNSPKARKERKSKLTVRSMEVNLNPQNYQEFSPYGC
ncbi:MAG: hypothetical protein OXE41_06485, partial [Gammaproteobacteria bacterium]|nr:hypothetical protein [Gammaproteobacteria bacterium]